MDPNSVTQYLDKDEESTRFYNDPDIKRQIEKSADVHQLQISPQTFSVVFLAGGHGPMFDLATDAALGQKLSEYIAKGGFIGAVCHGPAGLLHVKKKGSAEPLVKGVEVRASIDVIWFVIRKRGCALTLVSC